MAGKWHSSELINLEYVEKKKSGSSNNWRKLNSWAFVRELAPHVLSIYQEEADNLLPPEVVAVKILVVQDMSAMAGCAERQIHTMLR